MYALILAATLAAPAEFRFNISHPVAEDAVILLELPVPEAGKRFKKITLEQFKKHGKLIVYLEYELKEVKLEGLVIKKAVFMLPKPPPEKPKGKDDLVTRTRQ